jgi:hypothetical protein
LNAVNLESSHPFFYVHNKIPDKLISAVWKAQMQSLFALVEIERIAFIDKWSSEIEEAIRTQYWDTKRNISLDITQYGEQINSAYDVEIGTLCRIIHLRRADNHYEYLLYLPEQKDRDYLELLRKMRNALAHTEPCTVVDVNLLLTEYPYRW